jgi:hypothetical protein
MGYTHFTVSLVEPLLDKVTSVVDLGAQNDYRQPLPAPYVSEWYKSLGKRYESVDLSAENNCRVIDLSKPSKWVNSVDLLVDAGTSEHVGDNGKFGWEAIYNCWLNKHNWLRVGGYMVNENPKTGNWPGHGFNYYTQEFYTSLSAFGGYELMNVGEHPAMGNTTDGWNVWSIMRKVKDEFITLDQFKTLELKQS